ncbi:DUF6191 domain-containing protein [Rhodococcus sp. APC 3903]|uniref:DUF6191 domain-containing protein n=1 Tax=Rhodococcus sp. APC 3903 TaxID=3035193 RepID=UPI0025B3F5BB|nr:DUF6191 domain-containing protein [Rhodococcus sp. APC 3903]MDN3460500.1 DUF6191 domain-containing protein [Rhodococcus sp. APC 3903]
MAVALVGLALPALGLLLIGLALIEGGLLWLGRRGLVPWFRERSGRSFSATAFDEYTAVFEGSKRIELDHRDEVLMLRNDETSGAPPAASSFEVNGITFSVEPNRSGDDALPGEQ